MKWAEAHRIAMIEAAHAHDELEVDTTRPVDVFNAIRRSGVILAFETFPRLSGVYIADRNAPGIAVTTQHGLARQRYTAAHELAHHRFKHGTTVDPEIDPLSTWGAMSDPSDEEKIAESFAAWFLMPRRLVLTTLRTMGISAPQTEAEVYQLSLRLGASYRATARQLENLRLASSFQVRQWLKIEPRRLKTELADDPNFDLRNDVWVLTPGDEGRAYTARPGDRLILELPEVPSSGYTWNLATKRAGLVAIDDHIAEWQDREGHAEDLDVEDRPVGDSYRRIITLDAVASTQADEPTSSVGLSVPIEATLAQPWDPEAIERQLSVDLRIQAARRGFDQNLFVAA